MFFDPSLMTKALQDTRNFILQGDPWQLASQVVARLLLFENNEDLPYLQKLLQNTRTVWPTSKV